MLTIPATAYSTLSLAVESWEGIKLIESNNVTMRYRDEIFEVYASLPDSASVIPFQPELETLLNIGTATNVLTHLKNMEDYMKYIKQYGGYVLAVGAGCYFPSNLLVGLGLLAVAGYWAYKQRCCAKKGTCTK